MRRRTILVTGGAKRLGAAIVRRLARDHKVVIHYGSSGNDARVLAQEVGGATVAADLSDADAVASLIARAREAAGGPIDGLVNSASTFEFDRPPEVDTALLGRLHAINLAAPVTLACALARQEDMDDGVVINLLDQKVANPNPDFFSYSCAKHALASATVMLSQAFAPRVRVAAVSPGLTLKSGDQSDAEFDAVSRENLLRRPVGAEQVADAVAFLIDCDGTNGENLFVDCGQRFLPRDGDVMFEGRANG